MAKKSFNISSTLNKNKEQKVNPPELAAKVPLTKKAKDVEELKEKVDAVHSQSQKASIDVEPKVERETTISHSNMTRASEKTSGKSSTKAKREEPAEKLVRLTIDTPESMHKRLKIRSIEVGVSMRDYILRLIEKDLKKK